MRVLLVILSALALAGCGGGTATDAGTASATNEDGLFARIPDVVRDVEPSIVSIAVRGTGGSGEGSGVVWDADGTVVTNNHVVAAASEIQVVLASGERLDGRVVATDELTDLAVVSVERTGLPAAEFAEELPEQGQLVLAMGNPLGFENSVTEGIVSGLYRSVPSGGQTPALVDLIQTSAAISPGNSGGALVAVSGKVVGINVAYIPPGTGAVALGFAIPAPTVVRVVRELLETGTVEHAFLGIGPEPLTPEIARQLGLDTERGVLVRSVVAGSAAERGGLAEGDVIVSVAGEPVETVEDLFAALRERRPGDAVVIAAVREGERRELRVVLAARPNE
jgi:S1-C subfamily serine protease